MPNTQDIENAVAARIAGLLSNAMNLGPILANPHALPPSINLAELRASLLHLSAELQWLIPIIDQYSFQGITFPPDLQIRVDQLRIALDQWQPCTSPPAQVLECARHALSPFISGMPQ